jgi:aspartate/methionine/tyrosine aminotransferase
MDLIRPSGTIAMLEKALEMERSGKKICHLEVGEPDFNTPKNIKAAAIKALDFNFTHYTSSKGILELRQAISNDLAKRKIMMDPEKQIIVTPGAKHAIYCACLATLNPGDEVLILTPTWPTHIQCIEIAKAHPIPISSKNYSVNHEKIKGKITKKARMIILNSPNNPTGGILYEKDLKFVRDISVDHNLLVLSDEVYDRIVYDGIRIKSIASYDKAKERSIVINGFSKSYAMTGWRLGYAAGDKNIINAIKKIQQSTTTCPTSFVQKAGIEALNGPQDSIKVMLNEYNRRRKYLVKSLNQIEGINCIMPKGAFYVFPDFSILDMSSFEISKLLLEEEGVSSTPGSVFGKCGEGHIRLSYATNINIIKEGVRKIKSFMLRHVKRKVK